MAVRRPHSTGHPVGVAMAVRRPHSTGHPVGVVMAVRLCHADSLIPRGFRRCPRSMGLVSQPSGGSHAWRVACIRPTQAVGAHCAWGS